MAPRQFVCHTCRTRGPDLRPADDIRAHPSAYRCCAAMHRCEVLDMGVWEEDGGVLSHTRDPQTTRDLRGYARVCGSTLVGVSPLVRAHAALVTWPETACYWRRTNPRPTLWATACERCGQTAARYHHPEVLCTIPGVETWALGVLRCDCGHDSVPLAILTPPLNVKGGPCYAESENHGNARE